MLTGYCYSQSDNLVCPLLSFMPDLRPISDTAIQFQRTFSLFFVVLLVFKAPFLFQATQVPVIPVITSPLHTLLSFGNSCITRFAR